MTPERHHHRSLFSVENFVKPWSSLLNAFVGMPLNLLKVIFWYALYAEEIISIHFFKTEADHNVTVYGVFYRVLAKTFSCLKMENIDVDELWFQTNGNMCHKASGRVNSWGLGEKVLCTMLQTHYPKCCKKWSKIKPLSRNLMAPWQTLIFIITLNSWVYHSIICLKKTPFTSCYYRYPKGILPSRDLTFHSCAW